MKIKVKLHPNSTQEKIVEIEKEKFYEVWIHQKPIEGEANQYLEKYLKRYFGRNASVIKGLKSREKVVEIL